MPAELPGFYWDEKRNRYFPLSSKPRAITLEKPPSSPDLISKRPESSPTRYPRHSKKSILWNTTETLRTASFSHRRDQVTHNILFSHYANTSRVITTHVPTFGQITAFHLTTLNEKTYRFLGDNRGWIYTSSCPETVHDPDGIIWAAEINLHPESEISSICMSGTRCVTTCFGPSAKISVQDLYMPGLTSLLSLDGVHDIRASHLEGYSLVLGASNRALYMHDVDVSPSVEYLNTQSDIFTVLQKNNLIYTGARNGSIIRFDKRMGKTHGQNIFSDKLTDKQRTSVLHLEIIDDSQLLASHMNGDLLTFDLRYPRRAAPTMRYMGHVNTYTHKLGIALDPNQEFIFAAGEDCRIRGWSVKTGAPLVPITSLTTESPPSKRFSQRENSAIVHNPFLTVFPEPIKSMQAVNQHGGVCLWAAFDQTLHQFHLGQR